jgi:hypothetical protein
MPYREISLGNAHVPRNAMHLLRIWVPVVPFAVLLIVPLTSCKPKSFAGLEARLDYAFCDVTASPRILAAAYCTERTML